MQPAIKKHVSIKIVRLQVSIITLENFILYL